MSGDGYIVTLEGHQPTITEQLRLLPFSDNILCLPPLDLPPAPPVRESLSSSDQLPPLDPAVRQFILSLHHVHVARLEKAKSFLADRQHGASERMVFLNGGFAAAQVACLETLRNALVSEENGNLENAAREAEWVFEDIVQGGVQGLLDLEDRRQEQERRSEYGTVEIGHIPSDVESISNDKPTTDSGRELFAQPLDIITPEPTPENTPKIPELIEIRRSPSPQKDRKPRVVSALRNPTLEEIAAGVEICKASVAVRVRSRSNATITTTTTTSTTGSKYSPPPSPPPVVRTEFHLGHHGTPEKRSGSMSSGFQRPATPRTSGRKERANNLTLPPIESMYSAEIPTPPSSAKAIPGAAKISHFPMFSDDYQLASAPGHIRRESGTSTRPSSPTPSSTADISGATILPSPRYLSGGFDAPPRFLKEPVDPLFPSVGENLVIYFPSSGAQNSQFLERVLSDFAVSFTPQTPGVFRSNPRVSMLLNGRSENMHLSPMAAQFNTNRESFQSVTSTSSTRSWAYRSSVISHPDPPLSSIPTVTTTPEKSPSDTQNELRAIMRHHFPPASSPSPTIATKAPYSPIDEEEDEDEDMHWLTEDVEIDSIWRPVLSSRGIDEGHAYSAIDLIVAVAAEEGGESTESRKGLELRRRLVEQVEEMSRKKGKASSVAQIGLKYLLSNALPHMRVQHPSTKDNAVLKGHFLLPELERYLSLNTHLRVLVVEFDFNTGSSAILELQRVLGPSIEVLKIACIADGVTQFASKPPKPSKFQKPGGSTGIRIRTSINATTTSYTLGPSTPTTPTPPNNALRIFPSRKPLTTKTPGKRPLVPKQRLISRADVVIPPFSAPSSGIFIDAVQALHVALTNREKVTGFYGGSKENEDQVPSTPGVIVGIRRIETEREREIASRQDTSYYLEEETDEEENHEGRRASFRRRVKNGSKALKWLGLE